MAVSQDEIGTNGNVHTPGRSLAGTFRLTGIAPPRGRVEFDYPSSILDERLTPVDLQPAPHKHGGPEADRRDVLRDETKRALGAVLIAAPLAPVLGAILSVLSLASWLSAPTGSVGLIWAGLGNLLIAWAILAFLAWILGLSTARGALPGTYGELVQWMVEIRAWLTHLNRLECRLPSLYARVAFSHLAWQYELIRSDLAENGAKWFVGTGYVNVWRRVHQAQEALVRLVSEDALPAAARIELLRFTGSDIDASKDAIAQLQAALAIVDAKQLPRSVGALIGLLDQLAHRLDDRQSSAPLTTASTLLRACDEVIAIIDDKDTGAFELNSMSALRAAVKAASESSVVLSPSLETDPAQVRTVMGAIQTTLTGLKPSATATTPTNVEQARDVIQVLRRRADEYRDKARMGLARTRSDLTRTLSMTAFLSYALFWIAIEARFGVESAKLPDQTTQVLAAISVLEMGTGAIALFLWGALVGLFGQLWTKWSANPDTGEDDFGLGISRLLAEPILAGVAGLCGVVVLTFGGPLLSTGLTGLLADPLKAAENLQNAFLPGSSPASLLYAAIFALSPNLLISRLQQAGTNLQKNLSNSSAGDGGGMSNGSSSNK